MVDFDALTSFFENTTADLGITTLVTICAHVFADGVGEGSFGRIIQLPEDTLILTFEHNSAAGLLEFRAQWSGTLAHWTFPANDSEHHAVAVSYDAGATGNTPVARVDYLPVTVTLVTAASGTFTAPGTGYCIGNRTARDRTWDGMLGEIQVFNAILTAGQMDQACIKPGSVRLNAAGTRVLQLWAPLYNAAYLSDLSGSAFNGTAGGLTDRAGGPRRSPLFAGSENIGALQTVTPGINMGWYMPGLAVGSTRGKAVASGMRAGGS